MQLLQGLLWQGGLSAHDPGELHMQHPEVGAAVDQRVVVVVGGQHPVRGRGRDCRWEGTGRDSEVNTFVKVLYSVRYCSTFQ